MLPNEKNVYIETLTILSHLDSYFDQKEFGQDAILSALLTYILHQEIGSRSDVIEFEWLISKMIELHLDSLE